MDKQKSKPKRKESDASPSDSVLEPESDAPTLAKYFHSSDFKIFSSNHISSLEEIADLTEADMIRLGLSMHAILVYRKMRCVETPTVKKVMKLPSNIPIFRGVGPRHYSDIDEFLTRFESCMEMSGIDRSLWSSAILNQFSNLTDLKYWKKNHASKDWSDAKNQFLLHFNSLNTQQSRIDSINSFAQQSGEAMQTYSDRFLDLVDLAHLDMDSPLLVAPFRRGITNMKLLSAIDAREAATMPYSSITALSAAAIFCESQLLRHDSDRKPKNGHATMTKNCSHHGPGIHDSSECVVLKRLKSAQAPQDSNGIDDKKSPPFGSSILKKKTFFHSDSAASSSSESSKIEKPRSSGYCYTCKKTGHWSPECPEKRTAKHMKVSVPDNDDNFLDEAYSSLTAFRMFKISSENNQFQSSSLSANPIIDEILCPLKIQGVRKYALVDTGTSHTIVSQSLCEELQLPIDSVLGTITLGNDQAIPRLGQVPHVTLECNGKLITIPCEVLAIKHDIILGLDAIPLLGMSINGVPVSH